MKFIYIIQIIPLRTFYITIEKENDLFHLLSGFQLVIKVTGFTPYIKRYNIFSCCRTLIHLVIGCNQWKLHNVQILLVQVLKVQCTNIEEKED